MFTPHHPLSSLIELPSGKMRTHFVLHRFIDTEFCFVKKKKGKEETTYKRVEFINGDSSGDSNKNIDDYDRK